MDLNTLKKIAFNFFVDIAGGLLIGTGIYNFAVEAHFPLAGVSGVALIFYHLFRLPIGGMTLLLNIPIVIVCFRILGRKFFFRSVQSVIITSLILDYVSPLIPVYTGDSILAAVCTGLFCGLGYAIIYMNNSSTGGTDFISMAFKVKHPHISLGRIMLCVDMIVIIVGGIIFRAVDETIYGFILTYIMTVVIDKIMYGIDAGKMSFIVTEKGQKVADAIDRYSGRGSTLLHGKGSYSGAQKQVVMCACNNKEMYVIRKIVKVVDPDAFTVILESNEVVGEGFKEA